MPNHKTDDNSALKITDGEIQRDVMGRIQRYEDYVAKYGWKSFMRKVQESDNSNNNSHTVLP